MKYQVSDAASEGQTITVEADSAQAALDSYISDALDDPSSYSQGEEGIGTRIRAYVLGDDGVEAEGVIDFGTRTADNGDGDDRHYQAGYAYACGYHD